MRNCYSSKQGAEENIWIEDGAGEKRLEEKCVMSSRFKWKSA
jgi:hypothetical protein